MLVRSLHIFTFLLVMLSCGTGKDKMNCQDVRDGRFQIKMPEGYWLDVERKGSVQEEYNPDSDTLTLFRVNWISDCEYELIKTQRRKKDAPPADSSSIRTILNDPPLSVAITAVSVSFYVFEARRTGMDFVYKDTMWKR